MEFKLIQIQNQADVPPRNQWNTKRPQCLKKTSDVSKAAERNHSRHGNVASLIGKTALIR